LEGTYEFSDFGVSRGEIQIEGLQILC